MSTSTDALPVRLPLRKSARKPVGKAGMGHNYPDEPGRQTYPGRSSGVKPIRAQPLGGRASDSTCGVCFLLD